MFRILWGLHSRQPVKFLAELSTVAHTGVYIWHPYYRCCHCTVEWIEVQRFLQMASEISHEDLCGHGRPWNLLQRDAHMCRCCRFWVRWAYVYKTERISWSHKWWVDSLQCTAGARGGSIRFVVRVIMITYPFHDLQMLTVNHLFIFRSLMKSPSLRGYRVVIRILW
jgi:hypothetical protein